MQKFVTSYTLEPEAIVLDSLAGYKTWLKHVAPFPDKCLVVIATYLVGMKTKRRFSYVKKFIRLMKIIIHLVDCL